MDPFHLAASVADVRFPLGRVPPTTVQVVAVVHEIALKVLKRLPAAFGEDCNVQLVPFQERARVASSSATSGAGVASEPTARQEVEERQETSRRIAAPSLTGFGVVRVVQTKPLKLAARVFCGAPLFA